MKTGKVWLVGAGPGDVGLLTLKGQSVLEGAEVVVYDALVGQGILARIPKSAALFDVGKRAKNHKKSQEEIHEILIENARKGLRVVRLKGGDPFLFGRGGEEAEALIEAGIPFEVVSGVTSPIAVAAYNGIPVTHRDFASSLHIISGHRRGGQNLDIDFSSLVKLKGTLVFLMGVSALSAICEGLIGAGMSPKMPAAILQEGTCAGQRGVFACLSDLPQKAKEEKIGMPSIIIVGQVCSLAEKFSWYEKLPLSGRKVILTRPESIISKMAEKLRQKGAEVVELPTISTRPLKDDSRLLQALSHMADFSWLLFTSPTGIDIFFEKLKENEIDIRKLSSVKIAVIGKGSQKRLQERGLYADFVPSVYDGAHMGKELAKLLNEKDRILIARAKEGNEELVHEICKSKAMVLDIATYERIYEKVGLGCRIEDFREGKVHCIAFTSASTVEGFARAMPTDFDFSLVRAACIGEQTAKCAQKYGMKIQAAKEASIDSLITLIEDMEEL